MHIMYRLSRSYLRIYVYIHTHACSNNIIKEAMNLKEISEGTWESLEIGKGREKYYNFKGKRIGRLYFLNFCHVL